MIIECWETELIDPKCCEIGPMPPELFAHIHNCTDAQLTQPDQIPARWHCADDDVLVDGTPPAPDPGRRHQPAEPQRWIVTAANGSAQKPAKRGVHQSGTRSAQDQFSRLSRRLRRLE